MTRPTRWPAEWEPHAATWLAWPHAPDTWPGNLAQAEREHAAIVAALAARERVHLLVGPPERAARAGAALEAAGATGIVFESIPTDDAWLRDTGPIFVERWIDGARERVALDFDFDAWGGKYAPWNRDAAVASQVARRVGVPTLRPGFVLEGGAIEGDGRGTVLTTESCLLNPNREPGRTRETMEARLAHWLGSREVLWLGCGIVGDDTDGHVDDVARFVAPGTVVAAVEPDVGDPNHAPLDANLRRLRRMRDADGKPLAIQTLPMPPAHHRAGLRCPASYANFYLANGVALVPTFGAPSDDVALAALREVLPDREVVGIPCETLVLGLGAIHCLSQQEPV